MKLGEIVRRAGLIDERQLETALGEQEKWGGRLGLVLVRLGYVSENDLVQALAGQLDLPVATLESKKIPQPVLDLVPYEYAEDHTCLPLFLKDEEGVDTLYVGMDDPSNLEVLDDLAFRTGMRVKPVVMATSEIGQAIDRFYRNLEPESRPTVKPTVELADDAERRALEISSRDTSPFAEEAGSEAAQAPGNPETESEPSTRLVLHALAQIMIEKGVMTREEFQQRLELLRACDEGELIGD